MKPTLGIVLIMILASTAFAQTQKLLSCNPPMGSGLQEVRIIQENNKIYRSELDFSGSYSEPVEISNASWIRKNLSWISQNDGRVHLYQVVEKGHTYWAYTANSSGISINGYCEL